MIERIRNFIFPRLAEFVRSGLKVLDVGCGEQPLRHRIVSCGGIYESTDIAQNRQSTVGRICPITALDIEDQSIDIVVCTEVLEHVAETDKAFSEIARVLKPGGILLLTTPFLYPLHEEPFDFVRLTPYQIERCCTISGFEIVEMERAGNELEVLAVLFSRSLLWYYSAVKFRPLRFFYSLATRGLQLLFNLKVIVSSYVLGRYLPKQAFLSTQCVLRLIPKR